MTCAELQTIIDNANASITVYQADLIVANAAVTVANAAVTAAQNQLMAAMSRVSTDALGISQQQGIIRQTQQQMSMQGC